jgi:hypothetical protein
MIQTGKLLIEAKAKWKHGEFVAMLRSDLPFGPRTAQRLMRSQASTLAALCPNTTATMISSTMITSFPTLTPISQLTSYTATLLERPSLAAWPPRCACL